ncbi:MAG: hypothetical protein QM751_03325 [Paludibacteraceae bacterium]
MKTYIKLLIIIVFPTFFAACENSDYQLQKSIFIEDETNPGLPIYSEWGYNTFGAYIDRVKFISDDELLPAKITVKQDTLNIMMSGRYQGVNTTLKFSIKGYSPKNYSELTALQGVKIDLKSSSTSVFLIQKDVSTHLTIIEGELYFKRVQLLFVDKEQTQSILSGVFAFKTFKDSEPIAVANGRFDFGIGYDNFYNY